MTSEMADTLTTRTEAFILQNTLLAKDGLHLVALSGGADSVALLLLLLRLGYRVHAAHCNFSLRGEESLRDELFVKDLCARLGVRLSIAHFDTRTYAEAHKVSIEMAARELRYAYFEQLRRDLGAETICVAHHRDDSVETVLLNLVRGTGIEGLTGIKARNGHIVRPLLPFGRKEIDDYVSRQGLEYVEDCTNSQTLYLRNRIRLQLMPLLRQLSPSFDSVMEGNMSRLADAAQIYQSHFERIRTLLLHPDGEGYSIDIDELKSLSPLKTSLFELLRPFGFSSSVVDEVVAALDSQSGKQFFSPSHLLVKDRSSLLIMPVRGNADTLEYTVFPDGDNIQLPIPLRFETAVATTTRFRLPSNEACFDLDRIALPLTLRHWRHGDRFIPFGMKGSRLVSDLFSDLKLSLNEKKSTWILCDAGGTILWVVGLRASATAAVTPSTKRILKVLQ